MASRLAMATFFVAFVTCSAAAAQPENSVKLSGFSCPTHIPGCAANRCTTRVLNSEETHVCLRCQTGYTPVQDGKSIVQCVPSNSNSIKLSGFSCPAQIPGCAAKRCTNRMINSQETPVCLRCQAGYVAVKDGKSTVQCVPAAQKTIKALSGQACPAQIPGCAANRCTTRMINSQETPVCLRCQAGYVAVKDGKSTVQCVPATTTKALSGVSCPDQIPGCAAKRCTTRMINSQATPVCLRCQAGYVAVKDGRSTVQCVPAATSNTTTAISSSSKALSGVSCPVQIPGCAANRCTMRNINSQETPVCLRCQAGYVAVKDGKSTVQCAPATTTKALSGVSCPDQIPGCAAKRCTTRMINSQATPVCLRCQAGYVAVKDGKSTVQCVPEELFAATSSASSNASSQAVQQQQLHVRQSHIASTLTQLVLSAVALL